MSLPPPAAIAQRDARRMARVLREVGGEGAAVGSGWMACDARGSWADFAAGLGVLEPPSDEQLDGLASFYEGRGRPARIQVSPYHQRILLEGLARRGYTFYQWDQVLGRTTAAPPPVAAPDGLEFELVEPEDPTAVAAFVRAQRRGFFDDGPWPEPMGPITERVARNPRSRCWLLRAGGDVVGSGGLECFETSGVLIAGCVVPAARKRGLQGAFLRFRVRAAAELGLDYVLVGSEPGGPTERNALRTGFRPLFATLGLQLVTSGAGSLR